MMNKIRSGVGFDSLNSKPVSVFWPRLLFILIFCFQGWDPLCKFLGKPVPEQKFPFENKATDKHTAADMMMQDTWIAKKAAREIKIMILSITFFSVLLAYLCLC